DWRELRLEDFDSSVHRKGVQTLVRRLKGIRDSVGERPAPSGEVVGLTGSDEDSEEASTVRGRDEEPPGLIDELARMEEILPRLGAYIEELNSLVVEITRVMESTAERIARADAANKGFAGRLA